MRTCRIAPLAEGVQLSTDLSDLLRRCQNQEEAAWNEFRAWFSRVAGRVLTQYTSLTPVERETAQDAARVKLSLAILNGALEATTNGQVTNYAKTVIRNCARDAWARHHPNEMLDGSLQDPSESPWDATKLAAAVDCMKRQLASWRPQDQFVFMMKVQEASAAAIRTDLERLYGMFVAVGTVDVLFSRLRQKILALCFGRD